MNLVNLILAVKLHTAPGSALNPAEIGDLSRRLPVEHREIWLGSNFMNPQGQSRSFSMHIKLVQVKQNVISDIVSEERWLERFRSFVPHRVAWSKLVKHNFIALITWKKLRAKEFDPLLMFLKALTYIWVWFIITQILSLYKHLLNQSKPQTLY